MFYVKLKKKYIILFLLKVEEKLKETTFVCIIEYDSLPLYNCEWKYSALWLINFISNYNTKT
jgi:hypothetical protein